MDETLSFGEWLRHRRRELDLTQEELGNQVGCARITIRKIEAGQMRPSRQLAELLLERVGIPLEEREKFVDFARGGELAEPITTPFPKHNLPHSLSSFIGRKCEITTVQHLMKLSRLVTLTGAGGSGKTRLAIEVARQALDQFSDGVWFISFASLWESVLVQQTIAAALRVREEQNRPLIETLIEIIYPKRILLIFDNCEHLIGECTQTAERLLQTCPHLSILATSREALNISGEEQYSVPTLSLPDANQAASLQDLMQAEAIHLFVERAEAVRSDFALTSENARAVVQICKHLDGIPLALELAAARVKGLSVEQIASRLDDRFHLLTEGNRTSLPRQRTLKATIDWSYYLLSEEERALLRRLSVFAGSWTLDAAEFMCTGENFATGSVIDLQTHLVDKSLVIAQTEGPVSRYRMLETIRQYALERLEEAGETRQARMWHLDFFLTWAEQVEPEFRSGEYLHWLNCMDEERDNLRAALGYSIASNQPQLALRLFGSTFWVWCIRGPWSEGQRWAETALANASNKFATDRAKTLTALGILLTLQTDYVEARKQLEQSTVLWRKLEEPWWYGIAAALLGFCLLRGNSPTATHYLEEAMNVARQVNDRWLLALCLHLCGEHKFYQGDLAGGRTLTEESLKLIHMLGDHMILCDVLGILGEMADSERDYPRALCFYEEALAIAYKSKDIDTGANLKMNMGRVYQITGDNDQAAKFFKDVLQLSLVSDKKSLVIGAMAGLGIVAHAVGDSERAVRLMIASGVLFDNLNSKIFVDPMGRAWMDECVKSVKAWLGEEKYSTLSEEGKMMTLEQAVNYALEAKVHPPSASV